MLIADVGARFSMRVGHVFKPWEPTIVVPKSVEEISNNIKNYDLICFGGGADIHPALYKHRNVASGVGKLPSYRDLFERHVFELAQEHKIPVLGICRGAQLVCALSGGSLIQDVKNHAGYDHKLITFDGKTVPMSSYHHQMMYPYKVRNHKVLAWTEPLSPGHYITDTTQMKVTELQQEPEVVWFRDQNTLAIQGHPEFYSDEYHPAVVYTRSIVNQYLLGGKYKNV